MTQVIIGGRIQLINIEVRNFQAHYCALEESSNMKPCYNDIKRINQYREYPKRDSKTDEKTLWRMAMDYYLDDEILCKRSFDGTLLRCLNEKEARQEL